MGLNKKKIIPGILLAMCLGVGISASLVKAAESSKLPKRSFDYRKEATASGPIAFSTDIVAKNINTTIKHFKNNGSTHNILKKETSSFGFRQPVYAFQYSASAPSTSGTAYRYSGDDGKRSLYIMEADTGFSYYSDEDYYIRSAAFDNIKSGKLTGSVTGTQSRVDSWRSILSKSTTARTSQDVRLTLSPSTLSFTRNGDYFESNWVNLNVDNNADIIPAFRAALESSTVNVSGAPGGTQVIRSNGSVASGGNIGSDTRFWIRIPVSSVGGTIQVSASVSSVFRVGEASRYVPANSGDSNKQVIGVRTTIRKTITSSPTGTATIVGGGNLAITKKGDSGELLGGASFQLKSGNTAVTGVGTTDSNGRLTFSSVPAGTYTLVETAAPWGYHKANDMQVTVPAGSTGNVTVTNVRARGDFKVVKKDDSGRPLAGAKFTLNSGQNVASGPITTDSNGEAIFRNMPIGGYSLVEVSAPEGYLIDPNQNWKLIEVEYGRMGEQTISNKLVRGDIKVTKVDYLDEGNKLSGAEFKLYDSSNNNVGTAITDSSGVAIFKNIPYGSYTVRESRPPTGYNLSSDVKSFRVTEDGRTYSDTFKNTRARDYAISGYNVKDSSGKIVGTLRKGNSYSLNTKLTNAYMNLSLPGGATLGTGKIDSFKYAIAVNDGSENQSSSSLTTSNLKGTKISSGERNNLSIRDLASIWETVNFTVPNDDSYSEIVFVVEIQASDDGNQANNKLVVKLPILNHRKDEILVSNMDVYPSQSGDIIVGNDVNVKLNVKANSLKTYDVDSTIKIEGPQSFGTKTIDKKVYGVSMEEDGEVYFKFKPTVAGRYTISAVGKIPGSSSSVAPKTITVVDPGYPKEYYLTQNKTKANYNTSNYVKTYVKVDKRDLDKVSVRYCNTPCTENTDGSKVCPGHEYWDWNGWYNAFVPRKTTQMTDIRETFNIESIKFRSKFTESSTGKVAKYVDEEGYIEMLDQEASQYANIKAGYGFDVKVKSKYENNLPEVFGRAYSSNTKPNNTSWSEYKLKDHSGSSMPFIYADSDSASVDSQVSSYSGAVSVAVPSMSDLILENPNQLYMKMPESSGEYLLADEGFKTTFNDEKVKQNVVLVEDSSEIKVNGSIYSDVKQFELLKDGLQVVNKRGYYLNRTVKDGDKPITFYNRFAGYGLDSGTRLHDSKTINIKVYGSFYDDIKDVN